jgi:hypothetical protein
VGTDSHRRRSQVVILDADGEKQSSVRAENSPGALAEAVAAAGPVPKVVLEATWGWYWVLRRRGREGSIPGVSAVVWWRVGLSRAAE